MAVKTVPNSGLKIEAFFKALKGHQFSFKSWNVESFYLCLYQFAWTYVENLHLKGLYFPSNIHNVDIFQGSSD